MVAPQVPTGRLIGQPVLGDQANSQSLDAAGIEALGQGQVGEVNGEATATAKAAMAGEGDLQIDGPAAAGIAQVMEGATGHGIAAGAMTTAGAAPRGEIAATAFHLRFG